VPAADTPDRSVADRTAPAAPEPRSSGIAFALPTTPARERGAVVTAGPSTATSATAAVAAPSPRAVASEAPADGPAPVPTGQAASVPIAPTEPSPAPAATTAVAMSQVQIPEVPAPPKPQSVYKDGTYLGWGTCRHGDIQAEVVIAAGRIASAKIAQCWTRYSCNWLDGVVPQVVTRQSPNVDYVSGATQSVDAFYWAVVDALAKAK
jgi:uncharacterized protein with FMN-binding domain